MFETESTSAIWGISPILFIVGGVYQIISIAAAHWLANPVAHLGLWNYCLRDGSCEAIKHRLNNGDYSWYQAVQGLEVSATVFILTGMVTGLMRINLGHRFWQTACGVSSIVAGLLAMTGVMIYGKNYQQFLDLTLSWAFVFNATSSVMCLLAGPVLIVDSVWQRF